VLVEPSSLAVTPAGRDTFMTTLLSLASLMGPLFRQWHGTIVRAIRGVWLMMACESRVVKM
jgi:hypothetical protein